MNKIVLVALVSTMAMTGACARAGAGPADAVPADAVPAGCEPAASTITWSPVETAPVLTSAWFFAAAAGQPKELPLERFTPSLAGVTAPASWLTDLGASLARSTGTSVHTTEPSAEGQSGLPADGGSFVTYTGVDRVSAGFEVRCDRTVRGTLTAWSRTVIGGAPCGSGTGVELDAFGRLAVALCPAK
ncbi:hypothetical protein ACQP2X_18255 [Actinoplanes sp. CA-131856]